MFILITYDVNITSTNGAKRLRNVAKACLNYGKRVQNSVFECILTEAQYVDLKIKWQESLINNKTAYVSTSWETIGKERWRQ